MRLTQDKVTGKWKSSPKGEAIFETRDQAKQSWIEKRMNEVRNQLAKIRNGRHK